MGKLILFNMTTPEGYFEGENGNLDWHHADAEFIAFAVEQLGQSEALLFGRQTFERMQAYWPTAEAFAGNPVIASLMESLPKVVVSKSMAGSDWKNTRFIKTDLLEQLLDLKQQSQKDLLIFGSAKLAHSLLELGLIDEYRLMVNPVLIGTGKFLFRQHERIQLKLTHTKTFDSGNVLLCYRIADVPKYVSL